MKFLKTSFCATSRICRQIDRLRGGSEISFLQIGTNSGYGRHRSESGGNGELTLDLSRRKNITTEDISEDISVYTEDSHRGHGNLFDARSVLSRIGIVLRLGFSIGRNRFFLPPEGAMGGPWGERSRRNRRDSALEIKSNRTGQSGDGEFTRINIIIIRITVYWLNVIAKSDDRTSMVNESFLLYVVPVGPFSPETAHNTRTPLADIRIIIRHNAF